MPSGGRLALIVLAVAGVLVSLYILLPNVTGLGDTWNRLEEGDPWWLSACVGLEILSYVSYAMLFRVVFASGTVRLGWRESFRITMAGVAATRLLATAGAGGVVLTVWALRRAGMAAREVSSRMASFLVFLYAIFMGALVVGGVGLFTGILNGPGPTGLTLIPAIFGAAAIFGAILITALSHDLDHAMARFSKVKGRAARWGAGLATVPAAISSGVTGAVGLLRTRNPELLGALGWWTFDIAVLWASFQAFGGGPPIAVIVMAYFVGALANVLPIPGGIGAVEGGIIGALVGFGVNGGLAIVAVLTYRAFSFWIPTLPGIIAYAQLLREDRADTAEA